MAIIDVDHFKCINDHFGHAAGDAALVSLVDTICRRLRRSDALGRLGGEEFGILLPGVGTAGAAAYANELRALVAEDAATHGTPFTVSIGVADLAEARPTADALIQAADTALYRAEPKAGTPPRGLSLPRGRARHAARRRPWRLRPRGHGAAHPPQPSATCVAALACCSVLATALQVLIAPAVVAAATLAARRWDARAGGLVSAFPAIAGPVLLLDVQTHGTAFAARAATGTVLGLVALSAFALVYGRAARATTSWTRSLAAGWAAAALAAAAAGALDATLPVAVDGGVRGAGGRQLGPRRAGPAGWRRHPSRAGTCRRGWR